MSAKRQMLVRARALMGFAELVRAQGGDAVVLLRRAGLKPAILNQPDATLPLETAARLLDAPRGRRSAGLDCAFPLRTSQFRRDRAGRGTPRPSATPCAG